MTHHAECCNECLAAAPAFYCAATQAMHADTRRREVATLFLQLKNAIGELLAQPGAQRPERIKFFRGQMQTIITRAVMDLGIKPIPSRRCFTLLSEFRNSHWRPPCMWCMQALS